MVESVLTEYGEVEEDVQSSSFTKRNYNDQGTSNANSRGARGNIQTRGRGRQPFVRHTGENDAYDMSIAPMNIYENQVLPIGIHNLSKSFRANLATI